MMRRALLALALAGSLALSACAVAPPSGPTVMALPGKDKSFAQFQQDDANCRQYASAQIGYGTQAQAATNSAVSTGLGGTVLGAAAGALLGAAAGNPAAGAAIGAGSGLLIGGSAGANAAEFSGASLQQRFDIAYTQCMYAAGNSVQRPIASTASYPVYGYPYWPYAYYPTYPFYTGPAVGLGLGFGFRFGGHHHGHWHGHGHWSGHRHR